MHAMILEPVVSSWWVELSDPRPILLLEAPAPHAGRAARPRAGIFGATTPIAMAEPEAGKAPVHGPKRVTVGRVWI